MTPTCDHGLSRSWKVKVCEKKKKKKKKKLIYIAVSKNIGIFLTNISCASVIGDTAVGVKI